MKKLRNEMGKDVKHVLQQWMLPPLLSLSRYIYIYTHPFVSTNSTSSLMVQ